jgi:hypothetical protein
MLLGIGLMLTVRKYTVLVVASVLLQCCFKAVGVGDCWVIAKLGVETL